MKAAACDGATLTRQTARSRGSATNSASRTERQSPADSSPSILLRFAKFRQQRREAAGAVIDRLPKAFDPEQGPRDVAAHARTEARPRR